MSRPEHIRCNICGTVLSVADAKVHASTALHTSLKTKLEQELESVKNVNYTDDKSVVLKWEDSI